jgi:hypothetical protein
MEWIITRGWPGRNPKDAHKTALQPYPAFAGDSDEVRKDR